MKEGIFLPNWKEVDDEIKNSPSAIASVRRKYLGIMYEYTNRNIITYYSAFLQKSDHQQTGIDDNDKNAFMQAVYGLNKGSGLDLILHTPGGSLAATESIVEYLKKIFNDDIRVFVPQIAMSAGTIIALSSREIIMGKQSNLGPIDPQFGGMSCAGILEEFKMAREEIQANPELSRLWAIIISKYHPTFLGDCKKAIDWAEDMVSCWLKNTMFKDLDDNDKENKVKNIVNFLSSHNATYSHQKHIHIDKLKELGVRVNSLEGLDDREIKGCRDLQDCVLTLHHSYMQTLSSTNILKIVENQNCNGLAITGS